MDIVLPPALFYVVGTVLIVFGALRAYFLGWKQKPLRQDPASADPGAAPGPGQDDQDDKKDDQDVEPAARGWSKADWGGHKRHLTFGLLFVVMGLFLVISTAVTNR